MKAKSRAWILLPAVIILITAIGFLLSNRQEELGLMEPGKSIRAAVIAAVFAADAASGAGPDDYAAFSQALLVATVARKNAALGNAADIRVDNLLGKALDCLAAAREAWQAELEEDWEPTLEGAAGYWNILHPTIGLAGEGPFSPSDIRRAGAACAAESLDEALRLVD